MPSTHDTGNISEAKVFADLTESGYNILEPRNKAPYDFVIDVSVGNFHKIQVKSGRIVNGSVRAELKRTNMTSNGARNKYYTESEVDFYAIYCGEIDKCFYVPFDKAPKSQLTLRLEQENSKYAHNTMWADEHRKIERFI